MLSLVSWIAAATELFGIWVVGNKNKWGFIINIVAGLMWIAVAVFNLPAQGLLLVVVPALFINTRNFIRWRRENKNGS